MFVTAVSEVAPMTLRNGARPHLLETWAHRDGWSGLWQRALIVGMPAALRQDDGFRPTPVGTDLAACVVCETVFGQSPVGLADHEGLPDDVAARRQQVASGR